MFQKKYAQAKPLLDELITSGNTSDGLHYALINYGSNFNPGQNHKGDSEAVFTVQMSVNDGSGNVKMQDRALRMEIMVTYLISRTMLVRAHVVVSSTITKSC